MRTPVAQVQSVVVKLGTQVLSDADRKLDSVYLHEIAAQVAALRSRGIAVTLVSSGAVGAGMSLLDMPKRPTDLATLQAVAAVGQRRLMDVWALAFEPHHLHVAQVLLTREDIDSRKRFLNLRNTIHAAQELGAVPIINENDTISTDEIVRISFGDNDILAANVACALRADLLIILSNVDGVLDEHGKPLRSIDRVEDAAALVRAEKSSLGKGGMSSKFEAARMMTSAGEMMIVAHGRAKDVLVRLISGEELGTLFMPRRNDRSSGKARWIGAVRPAGKIIVDDGAARAIHERDVSLLPAGIVDLEGDFEKGDIVAIVTPTSHKIAHGLTNYSAADLAIIKGKKTSEVRAILKERAYDEVIHRDNLVKLT
ncbi:MAG: glutamate 5-kinase [Burkholderiales bacterium]|nr:glutamate 5-kinase [Phycisphaerae bacterium]